MTYSSELRQAFVAATFTDEVALQISSKARLRQRSLLGSLRKARRREGIYEAHLRGVRAEEIAHYGDYTVEFVEDCIHYGKMCAYSAETGNAIILKIPEE